MNFKNKTSQGLMAFSISILSLSNVYARGIENLQNFIKDEKMDVVIKGKTFHMTLRNLNSSVNQLYVLSNGLQDVCIDVGDQKGVLSLTSLGIEKTFNGEKKLVKWDSDYDQIFGKQEVPFKSIDKLFYIRSTPKEGYRSNLELATDWLREAGSWGEALISFKKDMFPATGDEAVETQDKIQIQGYKNGPAIANVMKKMTWSVPTLGIKTATHKYIPGQWYPAVGANAWVSVNSMSALNGSENTSLAYLMAVPIQKMTMNYEVGVSHPDTGWSDRSKFYKTSKELGPDGFNQIKPVARTGMVPPWAQDKTVMIFAGGFKRKHSAFAGGPLAEKNNGSHYGFAENGVVLSRLNEGLMTIFQKVGEPVKMKVWTTEDNNNLQGLIFARQNGLPLIEDEKLGKDLNISFGGNWSGDQNGSPQSMRSSVCLSENNGQEFLIYGVFSKALPKEMASMLQSYHCKQAMQLDMNAPNLTYGALYSKINGKTQVSPLIDSMNDKNFGGIGRFLSTADSRDFFYLQGK